MVGAALRGAGFLSSEVCESLLTFPWAEWCLQDPEHLADTNRARDVMYLESQQDNRLCPKGRKTSSRAQISQSLTHLESLHSQRRQSHHKGRAHTLHIGAKEMANVLDRDREGYPSLLFQRKRLGDRARGARRPLQDVSSPFAGSSSAPHPPPPTPAWAVGNWEDQSFCPAGWL